MQSFLPAPFPVLSATSGPDSSEGVAVSIPSFFLSQSPGPHEGVVASWPQRIMLRF